MKRTITILSLSAFILFIILSNTGCNRAGGKAEKISRLDSLENNIKNLEQDLDQLDIEKIKNTYLTCKEDLDQLHAVFQQNPLQVKEETLLQFENLKLSLNKLVADVESIDKEVRFSRQQVAEWRASIEKNDFSGDEFNQYLKTESGAMYTLGQLLSSHKEIWLNNQERIEKIYPEVKHLIGKK